MQRINLALAGLTLATALAAPADLTAQRLSPAQRAAVADTILAQADHFIAALSSLDIVRFTGLFTADPDLIYVDNGRIYPDRAALAAAAGGFFKRVRSAAGKWEAPHALPLSLDSGAFTGIFRAQMADTAGQPLWTEGKIWTLVYQRRGGRWVIVQAHEVNAAAR
jgi:hypothetical protein